jgi:hypothetical protein
VRNHEDDRIEAYERASNQHGGAYEESILVLIPGGPFRLFPDEWLGTGKICHHGEKQRTEQWRSNRGRVEGREGI